jgi:2-polyprenyl-3-methyl-5-hydroxy-6-metoxy-1,4-benzoquinol methylase
MNEFDIKALTWDENPQNVKRAETIGTRIIKEYSDLNEMNGFEYGCGTGLVSMNLQPHLKSITLADTSNGMLEVLMQKIEKHGISNMKPVKTDLMSGLPVNDKYDIIYTSMTLHHVMEVDALLKKFYDTLNASGHLCIADLDPEDGSFHGDGFVGHLGFNREKLTEQVKNSGFKNVSTENCFVINKKIMSGEDRSFQVFLLLADKI